MRPALSPAGLRLVLDPTYFNDEHRRWKIQYLFPKTYQVEPVLKFVGGTRGCCSLFGSGEHACCDWRGCSVAWAFHLYRGAACHSCIKSCLLIYVSEMMEWLPALPVSACCGRPAELPWLCTLLLFTNWMYEWAPRMLTGQSNEILQRNFVSKRLLDWKRCCCSSWWHAAKHEVVRDDGG